MSANILAMTIISVLHEIFNIIWIGGMSIMLLAILPALKISLPDKKLRKPVMDMVQKKLSVLAITSMIGLTITGLLMMNRETSILELFDTSTQYTGLLTAKHLIGIVMVIISLVRRYYMDKIFGMKNPKKDQYNFILLLINVILGWIVLFLSSYMVLSL